MEKDNDKSLEEIMAKVRAASGDEPRKDKQEKKMDKIAEPDEPKKDDAGADKDEDDDEEAKKRQKYINDDLARSTVEDEPKGLKTLMGSRDLSRYGYLAPASALYRGVSLGEERAKSLWMATDKYERRGGVLEYGVTRDESDSIKKFFMGATRVQTHQAAGKPEPSAEEWAHAPLRELARERLRAKGLKADEDLMTMMGMALTSTDLPSLLLEVAKRRLLRGFAEAQETWPRWTDSGSATDFRPVMMIDVISKKNLAQAIALGKYSYPLPNNGLEEGAVDAYERQFSVSRQAIINDDWDAVTVPPQELGRDFARLVGDQVYDVLTSDIMADEKPLFDGAAHSNVIIGGGDGTPRVDSISKALLKMGEQTDSTGKCPDIKTVFFLAPEALRASSETFFSPKTIDAPPTTPNAYHGHFTRIYDYRLDKLSPTTWYLVGEKSLGVMVLYLKEMKNPSIEDNFDCGADAVKFTVRFAYGVKAVSWRNFIQVKVS
ncbi:MAG: hypothetical protein LBO66_09450 [Deltaproteobacteria bacterium]|jgi:hypothetical protein|nr:hypothetical protein [Deltaproteobacteria bacterium]